MKRAPGLVELRPATGGVTRRDFCAFAAAGAAGLALAGCTGGGPQPIQTGGLTGDDGNAVDASSGGSGGGADAGTHPTDGGGAAPTCPATGATDVGAASSFALNTPVYNSSKKLFVVRDAGGLYALTAVCTHEGATCDISGSYIYCPRHGAEFTFDGDVVKGPATRALVHYAMCTLAGGHVGVITSMQVAETERLNA